MSRSTPDNTAEEARSEHAERIFDEALSRPTAAREAFVKEACGDDAALDAEVQSMLSHYASTHGALHQVEASHALTAGEHEDAPPRIGAAEVLDQLEADGPIDRWVTRREKQPHDGVLSVLRGSLSHEARRRLTYRAEGLARAAHQALPRVLETGSIETGRGMEVFLVHERIEGVPCNTSAAQSSAELQRVIDRLAALCDALEDVHRRGLFHGRVACAARLTDGGVVRLAEPGFAGLLAGLPQDGTSFKPLPGPRVTAPEWATQQGIDLDGRVDVFAVGQLLESACGTLDGRLAGRTRRLVDRCLSNDRDNRPRSGGALADELRALLHEEQAATEQDFSPRSLLVTVVLCLLAAAAGFAAHAWLFAPAAATTTN